MDPSAMISFADTDTLLFIIGNDNGHKMFIACTFVDVNAKDTYTGMEWYFSGTNRAKKAYIFKGKFQVKLLKMVVTVLNAAVTCCNRVLLGDSYNYDLTSI